MMNIYERSWRAGKIDKQEKSEKNLFFGLYRLQMGCNDRVSDSEKGFQLSSPPDQRRQRVKFLLEAKIWAKQSYAAWKLFKSQMNIGGQSLHVEHKLQINIR